MFTIALTPPLRRARTFAAPLATLFRRQTILEPLPHSPPGIAALVLRGWQPREVEPRQRRPGRLGAFVAAVLDLVPFWRVL